MHVGVGIEHDAPRPLLVHRRAGDGLLEEVRQGPWPTSWRSAAAIASRARSLVICCQYGSFPWIARRRVSESFITNADADGVSEARVLGAGKRERRDAELPHAAEPLDLGRVDERAR